jgi:hypothetical protein
MYGTFPFEGRSPYVLAASIITGKIKKPPYDVEQKYSEKLKYVLSSLLSSVCNVM